MVTWQGISNKIEVVMAKELLKETGHAGLASRLGRLSRLRNGTA